MESTLVSLDIRPVEPKDRYERIMGTYEQLAVGDVLELTVDHDPQCMYYTLRATRGEEAFSFVYLEQGPETWRVLVGKKTDAPERE
ncbi:MAG TPA: DUF2249 domain-containing protein [Longimicrobiales bacterium]|nr:DUF2249 domain-containing protein [Longimicrobiales bacterium]